MPDENNIAALAGALARAQVAFPQIVRSKEVTVTTKSGGSYKFKYAPLDTILDAVRKSLAENGLAITQLLDEGDLVTMLLHVDGGLLSGRMTLPLGDGNVQALGSAITYLRRYSIQALLGIAAEEDDDGNRAAGNSVKFSERNPRVGAEDYEPPKEDGLIGVVEKGKARTTDYALRLDPDGNGHLGFRLLGGGGRAAGLIVEAHDDLAKVLASLESEVVGKRVQVWGHFVNHPLAKGGSYDALYLERIAGPDFILPADLPPGSHSDAGEPMVDEAEPLVERPQPGPSVSSGPVDAEAVTVGAAVSASPSAEADAERIASTPALPPPDYSLINGKLCGNRGSLDTVCNLEKGHAGKHRELATDGRVLASW